MPNSGDMIELRAEIECAQQEALSSGVPFMHIDVERADSLLAVLSSLPQSDDRELVALLNRGCSCGKCKNDGCCCGIMGEAADRLLQLSRDVDLLRELLDEAFDLLGGVDDAAELRGKILGVLPPVSSGISEQGEM